MIRYVFNIFPLLLIPVILYVFMAFGAGNTINPDGAPPFATTLDAHVLELSMASGVKWVLTIGDLLLLLAIVVLFVEIIKSASSGAATIINHGLSMAVFLVCFVAFLLLKNFATSTFFFLTMMALIDVLAGFTVSIVTARRDFGVGGGIGGA